MEYILGGALVCISAPVGNSQQFQDVSSTQLVNLAGYTEAARFADLDLDGDLDLLFANGGDIGNQSSRVLTNQGGAQGGTMGFYLDSTATSIPGLVTQSSRDVQAMDIDNDGDLDLCFSNHSTISNQSNTWFVNQGGAQGGTAGVFVMDMSRYTNIAGTGSSVPSAQKITSGAFAGGFIDWSAQCDFADVDLDGDMDLLQTSYGATFSGNVMSRLFLNGSGGPIGYFKEYNPSGAVSANPNLASGSAAGWAEGTQSNNTLDTLGISHDITNTALDADFSDLDGDFDNDMQMSSRDTQNRMYQNRFFENGGSTGSGSQRLYRDLTNTWMTSSAGLPQSGFNYDAEPHDVDQDGDVDTYFLNYTGLYQDRIGINDGTGKQTTWIVVPNSTNDDQEIDWHDLDHDGDIDPFVSAAGGVNRYYQNLLVENGGFALSEVSPAPVASLHSLAADVGDIDNDGDVDIVFAEDKDFDEVLLLNTLNSPDPIAPTITNIQQLANGTPSSTPRRIVARAFDNINLEYFKNASASLNFSVNGDAHSVAAQYAGGNLFRAMIPGYWCGSITYSLAIADRVGNAGVSPSKSFTVSNAGFTTFGAETPGCHGPITIGTNSCPTVNNSEFVMSCTGAPPTTIQLCLVTNSQGLGYDEFNIGVAIWAGVAAATEIFVFDAPVDGLGKALVPAIIPNNPALAGSNYYFQFIFADFSCANTFSGSGGGHLTIQP
ncbi:MAG: VCBS repeat-containing protein [Planctomycetes bacterium]|nr:VCBS repeat-containing protein [Planctomycetota bacterium]